MSKSKKIEKKSEIVIYQAKNGAIELQKDLHKETVWASLDQISVLFGRDKSVISRHIKNVFKVGELKEKTVVAKNATTAADGKIYQVVYYNLDMIISVGYRVNSKTATKFRQWATKTLHYHIVDGYTINPTRISKNYQNFLEAVEDIKKLLPAESSFRANEVLELVKVFANTWFSLNAYDKSSFPKTGMLKKQVDWTAAELAEALTELKKDLVNKKEATKLFGQETKKEALAGIVGNVLQSFGGKDLYESLEEKAAHLIYFIIKNHPFSDGNKRSGAFAFVWFLQKGKALDSTRLTPEVLTTLTLLIAESDPKEKERMVGVVLMILRRG